MKNVLPFGLQCKQPQSTPEYTECSRHQLLTVGAFTAADLLFSSFMTDCHLWRIATANLCINKNKQRDNGGQRRNVTYKDGYHLMHVSHFGSCCTVCQTFLFILAVHSRCSKPQNETHPLKVELRIKKRFQ